MRFVNIALSVVRKENLGIVVKQTSEEVWYRESTTNLLIKFVAEPSGTFVDVFANGGFIFQLPTNTVGPKKMTIDYKSPLINKAMQYM